MVTHTLTAPPHPELQLHLQLDESCAEAQDGELDGLWTTITVFISLFLLSVCYSATVTLFKVGLSDRWAGWAGLSSPQASILTPDLHHCRSSGSSHLWQT